MPCGPLCTYRFSMKLWLDKMVGDGGFGRVYVSHVTSSSSPKVPTGVHVAVKKMHITKHTPNSVLRHEACVCLLLGGHASIPEVYAWGRSQYYDYLAMELLGDELPTEGMTLRNFAVLACSMLDALEHIHSHGIVHCDVKPNNFIFGASGGTHARQLKLIDFGLTMYYRDPLTGAHRPELSTGRMRGTGCYASIPGHMHRTPGRRDDLESLAYTLVELAHGHLPWGRRFRNDVILRQKVAWRFEDAALLPILAEFVEYTRALAFAADPDYAQWRAVFRALVPGLPENAAFDPADDGPRINTIASDNDDDDEVVDPPLLPTVRPPSSVSGDSIPDSDDGWMPTTTWPAPCSIPPAELIGDEQATVREYLEHIEEPPGMAKPWLLCCDSPERMVEP